MQTSKLVYLITLFLLNLTASSCEGVHTVPPQVQAQQVTLEEFPVWMKTHLNGLTWSTHEHESTLTREILEKSFALGRRFMINNQKPEGNFNYQYDFVNKEMDPRDSQVR